MTTENVRSINMLPKEEIFFLKKINLENTFSSSIICYARKISEQYTIHPEEKAKGEHIYFGYKEDEYPCDELDKKILEQVQIIFPNAVPQTSLMMFDVEKENNAHLLKQYKRDVQHISIEYIPTSYPYTGAEIYQKDIEVFYFPTVKGNQTKYNSNVNIVTDNQDEYKHLCSLLKETYNLFSNVCKL